MATQRFNRQFILLDFDDLDNPEYMEFVRSPEFSTYLIMRRYVWRSDRPHSKNLHEYYAKGLLACAVNREKLAEAAGNISPRQITRDISALLERNIIKAVSTGRGNVYILGKCGHDPESGAYYEYFFLDRLHQPDTPEEEDPLPPDPLPPDDEDEYDDDYPPRPSRPSGGVRPNLRLTREDECPVRLDTNVTSDWTPKNPSGHSLPVTVDNSVHPGWSYVSSNNRESNNRTNREDSNISKGPGGPDSLSRVDMQDEEEGELLASPELEVVIETCSREFDDMQHLESNLTRAFNLWAQTKLDEEGILAQVLKARARTKRQISISAIRDREKKMAYFFAVLESLLELRQPKKHFA
jgi:hypothetical protein